MIGIEQPILEKRDEFQLYGIYDAFIISYGIPSKDSYLYDKESKEIDLELDSLEKSRIDKIKLNDPDAIFYSEKDTSPFPDRLCAQKHGGGEGGILLLPLKYLK